MHGQNSDGGKSAEMGFPSIVLISHYKPVSRALFLQFKAHHDVLVVVQQLADGLDRRAVTELAGQSQEFQKLVGLEGEVKFLLAVTLELGCHGKTMPLEGIVVAAALPD